MLTVEVDNLSIHLSNPISSHFQTDETGPSMKQKRIGFIQNNMLKF